VSAHLLKKTQADHVSVNPLFLHQKWTQNFDQHYKRLPTRLISITTFPYCHCCDQEWKIAENFVVRKTLLWFRHQAKLFEDLTGNSGKCFLFVKVSSESHRQCFRITEWRRHISSSKRKKTRELFSQNKYFNLSQPVRYELVKIIMEKAFKLWVDPPRDEIVYSLLNFIMFIFPWWVIRNFLKCYRNVEMCTWCSWAQSSFPGGICS